MTTGGAWSVDTAAVKNHSGNLEDALSQFASNSKEFDDAMNDLLGTGMKDGAEEAFRDLHSQWMEAGTQVQKGLEQLGLRTDDVAKAFDQGKQDQADQVRSAGAQMNFHVQNV